MNLDNNYFEGKGIFVFTDPGGANGILAIIDYLILKGKLNGEDFLIYTNNKGKYDLHYKSIVKQIVFSKTKSSDIIKSFNPDYIFCATSNNDFEHNWRIAAKQMGVYTISFIDHWTKYLKRFTFNSNTVFSDEIWVIDSKAKSEAILDGIPRNILKIRGNPYYDKVKNYKPKDEKDFFFKKHKINPKKSIILFISDEIKDIYENNEKGDCALGFDEFSILLHILTQLKKIEKTHNIILNNYQLIIKVHPKCDINKYEKILSYFCFKNIEIVTLKECNPLDLITFSNLNLGMFSNMVYESFLMFKEKTHRIQIGDAGRINFFDEIDIILEKEKLYELLFNHIKSQINYV